MSVAPHAPARLRRPIWRFLSYVAPHKWYIVGAAAAGCFKFLIPLTFPLVLKYVTDVVLMQQPAAVGEPTNRLIEGWCRAAIGLLPIEDSSGGRLFVVAGSLLALYAALGIASYYRGYWAGQARHRMIFDLRYDLFQHIQNMSHAFFDERRSGAIVARFISDIGSAQNFVGSALTNVWMDGVALAVVVWILFVLEPRLALVALGVMPFYIGLVRYFGPRIKATSQEVQELVEDFSGDLQEKIAGAAVVKAFGREDHEAQRFYDSTRRLQDVAMRNVALSSASQAATAFLTTAAPLIVIWAASILVLEGKLGVGTMIAVYAYLGSLYLPLQRFSELGVTISNSTAAMERIFEFFDIEPQVVDAPGARDVGRVTGRLTFENVSFRYPSRAGRPVLQGVTFEVLPGETVAIVGRSGAGKTTLASLIPRFYDVAGGVVTIDGVDVREMTLASLRRQIGVVAQDPILFSCSVQENLLYGKPQATSEEVLAATRAANAHEFIEQLPEGYLTVVGERGLRLSGGQRQRVAIARTFLKDPPILILDEATASLDSESENLIHEALRRLMQGRTTFIIAHRLSTVLSADRILVMERGHIVDSGRHADLLARGGVYRRLYEGQFRDSQPLRAVS
jgi:subfamily B ATP-binding cassette protein MsbA